MKSFASSFKQMGRKRSSKKKGAAKKPAVAQPPEAPLSTPVTVKPATETVKTDDKVESMPRYSEVTATPSEDTGDEASLADALSLAPSESEEGLLDAVAKVSQEPAEDMNDLIFDVSKEKEGQLEVASEPEVAPEPEVQVEPEVSPKEETTKDIAEENFVQGSTRDIILPPSKVDVIPVSQAIYGTVKKVWSFGTKIPIFNLWMGATHHVAEKVVGVVGQELSSVDNGIETKLAEFDFHFSRVLGR